MGKEAVTAYLKLWLRSAL